MINDIDFFFPGRLPMRDAKELTTYDIFINAVSVDF